MFGSLANRKAGDVQKALVFGLNNQSFSRDRDTTNIEITNVEIQYTAAEGILLKTVTKPVPEQIKGYRGELFPTLDHMKGLGV